MSRIPSSAVAAVRRFNRFYTRWVGALDGGHLGSAFSLTEVRVLYELAHSDRVTARTLARDLGLDEGYLSRILARFAKLGIVRKEASIADGRVAFLRLTPKGTRAFEPLDGRADDVVRALLAKVDPRSCREILGAMRCIERNLDPPSATHVVLRAHRPGDLGWIVHRHGALYAEEYGYDFRFEAIVAKVAADFLERFDASREHCWIAQREGEEEILGSVMLVKKSPTVAKLRLLYLEPHARGLGLGRRLVDQCIGFAHKAGYRKITLWTQSSLVAARHIYQKCGFRLVDSKEHADFGPREAAETWELALK
jgi:DNA-binding MarR family transcriptional regulator/ribosomal protein S18 acetylase RimI-like enzyme